MRLVCFAALVVGCTPKTAPHPAAGPTPGSPELHCPPGTQPNGFDPPDGIEVWCSLTRGDGKIVREGPSIAWHPSGVAKSSEGAWSDDVMTGEWSTFYPTGTVEQRGTYTNGRKDGMWTSFAVTGEKTAEGEFVGGLEQGQWTFWNIDTLTRAEGVYVLGKRDGVWLDYSPEGKALRERIYRDGRLISQREL